MDPNLSRRSALSAIVLGTAASGLTQTARGQETAPTQSPAPATQPTGACTLLPQAVEGPFYFDPKLVRPDIAEDRPGAPVQLELRIIESGPCTPIANVRVDIWHADASGAYSGYDGQGDRGDLSTKGDTFLRGTQIANSDGRVTFRTVYPGWYPGRTPHIHVKVFLDQTTLVTGQIYFPDALSERIYTTRAPYNIRSHADTTNADDFLFREGEKEGGGIVLAVAEEQERIVASLVIAVDRTGAAARGGVGGFLRRMIRQ